MRFQSATSMSKSPEDFGVIIHSIDQMEDPERPWAVCSATNMMCGFLSDRISASVVYKGKTSAYSGGGGVIVRPQFARVLCGYGGDGGTRGKTCKPPGVSSSCMPGCVTGKSDTWCDPAVKDSPQDGWCDGHPWRPSDMGKLLARDRYSANYNEVILDGAYWNAMLPNTIEAMIASPGDPQAGEQHAKFLSTYGLTAEQVPLVVYSPGDLEMPFRCEVCGQSSASSSTARGKSPAGASGDVSSLGYG